MATIGPDEKKEVNPLKKGLVLIQSRGRETSREANIQTENNVRKQTDKDTTVRDHRGQMTN